MKQISNLNFYKCCVVDLDGTLVPSSKILSELTIKIFKKYRDMGGVVIIATGRNKLACDSIIEAIGAIGCVTQNGSITFYKDDIIANQPINQDSCIQLIDTLLEIPDGQLFVDLPTTRLVNKPNNDPTTTYCDDFSKIDFSLVHKIAIRTASDIIKKIDYEKYGCKLITHTDDPTFFVIINSQNDKSLGIQPLLEKFGLTFKDVLCFGNDYNDLGIIKLANCSVVPENSDEYIKDNADFICESNEVDGVTKWFNHYLSNFS